MLMSPTLTFQPLAMEMARTMRSIANSDVDAKTWSSSLMFLLDPFGTILLVSSSHSSLCKQRDSSFVAPLM